MLAVDGQSPETVDQFLDSVSRSMDSVAEGLNSLMNKAEGAIKEFGDAADEAIAALKATPSQIPQVVHVESRSSNPQTYEEAGKPLARFDVWLTDERPG